MVVTVPKIGSGTENDMFRPDTNAKRWQMVEERATEFVIEILE
jgi:hypothetical protein